MRVIRGSWVSQGMKMFGTYTVFAAGITACYILRSGMLMK